MKSVISLSGITRVLNRQPILRGISLSIPYHQACAIVGTSGSGKSTLLNLIGLLDKPCGGQLILDGQDMTNANDDRRALMRNRLLGFIFQSFNLLPRLSALDNVALPLCYRGIPLSTARQAAHSQLVKVGLEHRASYRPADLSGGQRQRVAIARALVTDPKVLLADEPTGSLDSDTAQDIVGLLVALNRQQGTTVLMVTHDPALARCMDRRLLVHEGAVFDA